MHQDVESNAEKISIREVHTPEALEQAFQIRAVVFVEEQGIPLELDRDGRDEEAWHILALDGAAPVATGRLLPKGPRAGKIERIAVLPSHRGRGLGRCIVEGLEALAQKHGMRTISLEAHQFLEAFYHNLGYQTMPGTVMVGAYRLIKMAKVYELV